MQDWWMNPAVWPLLLAPLGLMALVMWRRSDWRLDGLPGGLTPQRLLILMSMMASTFRSSKKVDSNVLFFQIVNGISRLYRDQGLVVVRVPFLRPLVFCFSPDTFQVILKSSKNLQKSIEYSFLKPMIKEGLLTSDGSKWRYRRHTLTSAFHFKILDDFVGVFEAKANVLVSRLNAEVGKEVDIVPFVTLCTLDIICETAMGLNIKAQEGKNSFYVQSTHRVAEAFVARLFQPLLWNDWLYYKTSRGRAFRQYTTSMDQFTSKVISDRKAKMLQGGVEKTKRRAFLDLLLQMHLSDQDALTEADIQEEVDAFMYAGHDNTAAGVSWALFLLGLHPEVQDRAVEEIEEVLGKEELRAEVLRRLVYLERVIKEAQRLYPSVPYIGRLLEEDVNAGKHLIPAGTTCMMFIYSLHRHPDAFPDAERFDPDRFLPDECAGRHPFAYCPFSAGPRSCIGQRFALMEEKVILSVILRKFRVQSLQTRDSIHLSGELVLRSKGGIRMCLEPQRRGSSDTAMEK